jgi:hypothetical protein
MRVPVRRPGQQWCNVIAPVRIDKLDKRRRMWWVYGKCDVCGSRIEQIVLTFPHEIREEAQCPNKACGKKYAIEERNEKEKDQS